MINSSAKCFTHKRIFIVSIADQIYEAAKPLPESLAIEALHFIEYLSNKAADRAEMLNFINAQDSAMKHVWDNPDDEIWNDIESL
jgi:hypothetical protein